MPREIFSRPARLLPPVVLALALPSLAGTLAPGLPERPTLADYARCSVRALLVTPQPPARLRAPKKSVEATRSAAHARVGRS